MRQLPVLLRREALNDLWQIGQLLRQNGASGAVVERFIDRIERKCISVGNAPYGYPAREDLGPGLRAVPFEKSALITYRVNEDAVEIVNVFYGGRDYAMLARR